MLTIVLVEQKLDFIAALANRVHLIERSQLTAGFRADQLSDKGIIIEFVGMDR